VNGYTNAACIGVPSDLALLNDPFPNNCEDFIEVLTSIQVEGGDAGCMLQLWSGAVCTGTVIDTILVDSATFGACIDIPGGPASSAELVGC
jgi:hypothetical protein